MFLIFYLLVFLVFLAFTLVLFFLKLIFKTKFFFKIIIGLWIVFISLPILLSIVSVFSTKMNVDKETIYGNYIIDRDKCAGKQANWQYNHYRFEIKENNKIYFYITENERIIKTIKGTVSIKEYYSPSPHLKLNFEQPIFHVLKDNPTLYREIWSFYYVFNSDKYGNMFFTKGNWKSIK